MNMNGKINPFVGTAFMLFLIAFVLAANVGLFWVIGSGFTSGVKAATHSCGITYPVEVVFAGDWMCEVEEKS